MGDRISSLAVSRRDVLKLMAAGTAASSLALTGCSSNSAKSGSSAGKAKTINIEFSWSSTDARNKAMHLIAAAFTAETGIKVKLPNDSVNYANIDKLLLREIQAKKQPDISVQYDYTLLELANANAIQPLDQYLSAWPASMKSDFSYPLEEMSVAGHTYGLRYSPTPDNQLYYHKDIYAAAGQHTAPVSFNEWVQVSQAVTTSKRFGINVPLVTSGTLHRFLAMWTSMIWAGGGDLYDASSNKPTFQDEPGVKAAQWFQDQVYNTKIIPKSCETTSDDVVDDQFTAGTTASITGSPGNYSGYAAGGVKDLVMAPMPNFADTSGVGTAFGAFQWVMVIPKGAQTEEAWQFINFTQQPAQQLILAKAGQVPTRKSILTDPFFKTPAAVQQLQIIDWMQVNPHKAPLDIPQFPELISVLGIAFQQIIANKADVASALQTAASNYSKSS